MGVPGEPGGGGGGGGSLQFGGFQEAVWAGALRMDVGWVWPGVGGGADPWVDEEREAPGLGCLGEVRLEGSQERERGEAFPVSCGAAGQGQLQARAGGPCPAQVLHAGPRLRCQSRPAVGPRDCTGELTRFPAGTRWPPSSLQALGPSSRSLGGTVSPHTVGSPGWLPSPHRSSVGAIAPSPLQVASVGVLRGPDSHLAVGRGWAPLLWTLESWTPA